MVSGQILSRTFSRHALCIALGLRGTSDDEWRFTFLSAYESRQPCPAEFRLSGDIVMTRKAKVSADT
jgi:hypothetical protein